MSSSSASNWTTRELNRIPSPSAKLRPSTAAVAGGAGGGGGKPPLVLTSLRNGVLTITMNDPKRLNAWTKPMMDAWQGALRDANTDDAVKAVILTGAQGHRDFYCAGVNLAAVIRPMHPRALSKLIVRANAGLFDAFLDLRKPIVAAVNGPAIGASVTSSTLCDAVVASANATFSTPFAKLGVTPEGCSSVNFARLMGEHNAQRMLGPEGHAPTAAEWHEWGVVDEVVASPDTLLARAQARAEAMVAEGRARAPLGTDGSDWAISELKRINAEESRTLARAFLSQPFLEQQQAFLASRKKYAPAAVFGLLAKTHPAWSKMV